MLGRSIGRRNGSPHCRMSRVCATSSSFSKYYLQRVPFGFKEDDKQPIGTYVPDWCHSLQLVPTERVVLASTPTPIHRWHLPGLPEGVRMFIKRDDLTGMQLSGNKVRKLEFLMAEALAGGHDCVITIGGIQSNHCRATATAASYLGMEAHLILRNSETAADSDPGLEGNLLPERLQGAHIHQVTKSEYTRVGSVALGEQLADQLRQQGKNPYVIPVGGSNALGCWGYIMAMAEIEAQSADVADLKSGRFSHIVMACGSGATTGGLAIANSLSSYNASVVGFGVCDSEDYFHDFIDGLFAPLAGGVRSRDVLDIRMAKGAGYAISRQEELDTVLSVAQSTGVVLDPVYSGKCVHGMLADMRAAPARWRGAEGEGADVLFVHTGGLLGMYEKVPQLLAPVTALGRSHRLRVQP